MLVDEFYQWPKGRVTGARGYEYDLDSLPAAQVSTPDESREYLSKDGDVSVEFAVTISIFEAESASVDVEDVLEEHGERAREALLKSAYFMAQADEILSEEYKFRRGEQGERAPARLDITFECFSILEG